MGATPLDLHVILEHWADDGFGHRVPEGVRVHGRLGSAHPGAVGADGHHATWLVRTRRLEAELKNERKKFRKKTEKKVRGPNQDTLEENCKKTCSK